MTYHAPLTHSRSGIPCLWERGGGLTNTGAAVLIGDSEGAPKKPLYVRRNGHLCNGEHALIPVKPKDIVVQVLRYRDNYEVYIFQVVELTEERATLEPRASYAENYENDPDNFLRSIPNLWPMICAAKEKSQDYHCRRPYYIYQPPPKIGTQLDIRG